MSRTRIVIVLAFALLGTIRSPAHAGIEAALADVNALIARSPDRAELYLRRAGYHADHLDWPAAEADVRRAAALAPDHPGWAGVLARIYSATGRLPKARAGLDAALIRRPDDAELLILRARVLGRTGNAGPACGDYARAEGLLANPPPELYLEWAALAAEPGQAVAILDAGLARLGPAVALLERAIEFEMQLGRTDAALERLDHLTFPAERKESWLKRRGDLLVRAGRHDEARQAYARALAAIEALPDWLRRSPSTVALATSLAQLAVAP